MKQFNKNFRLIIWIKMRSKTTKSSDSIPTLKYFHFLSISRLNFPVDIIYISEISHWIFTHRKRKKETRKLAVSHMYAHLRDEKRFFYWAREERRRKRQKKDKVIIHFRHKSWLFEYRTFSFSPTHAFIDKKMKEKFFDI